MPDAPRGKTTWLGSAGYAAGGSLITVAILGLVALLGWIAHVAATPRPDALEIGQAIHGFDALLGVTVGAVLLGQVLLATLLPLPLQATALQMRRHDAKGLVFAKVAALTLASTLVSFLVLFPGLSAAKLMLETADAQALFLAGVLALLYLVHALGLAFGRRFARAS